MRDCALPTRRGGHTAKPPNELPHVVLGQGLDAMTAQAGDPRSARTHRAAAVSR